MTRPTPIEVEDRIVVPTPMSTLLREQLEAEGRTAGFEPDAPPPPSPEAN